MTKPFIVNIAPEKIANVASRVNEFSWPPVPEDEGPSWRRGVNSTFFKSLCDYWVEGFDWTACQAELNKFPQFISTIDNLDIHYVHVKGEGRAATPLILSHGWPGSPYEFWDVIERLAFPSRFGGASEDAFNVVVPSLPGFAFSGKLKQPIGPKATASLWNQLMTEVLGYQHYLAQGGDFGSIVTHYIALGHPACRGIHLNMVAIQPHLHKAQTDDERSWFDQYQARMSVEGSYLLQHANKPQTTALALADNPVGAAAWILEKLHGWSDLRGKSLVDVHDMDRLLTAISIYILTDNIATSIWFYNGHFNELRETADLGRFVETPTGIANFANEPVYPNPPRSWIDRMFNVVHSSEFDTGGHFAAWEASEAFASDIATFARTVLYH